MNTDFHDINFKLCVIQELMYRQEVIVPKFDIYEFVANYKTRKIDIDDEGYDIIPEALKYFRELEIPQGLLANISQIYQDGGNDIYGHIFPFWTGEDDTFNITGIQDIQLLPALKKMIIFYGDDKTILDQIKAKNIDAEYL